MNIISAHGQGGAEIAGLFSAHVDINTLFIYSLILIH